MDFENLGDWCKGSFFKNLLTFTIINIFICMNDYYVYVYLNQLKGGKWTFQNHVFDFQPFYVGKGKKERETSHLFPSNLKSLNHKNNTIKEIVRESGEVPVHLRIYENLSNDDAIKIEAEFIKKFGRVNNESGILTNMTDGGEGVNNFVDKNVSKIWARKKVYQYNLDGEFIKEWCGIGSVDLFKSPTNISTSIKKGGTLGNSIWSYTMEDSMKPRIKNQMKIKFKNIKQIDKDTGIVINIFESALLAEKELNLRLGARNKIYECIKGILKTAYGYKWEI